MTDDAQGPEPGAGLPVETIRNVVLTIGVIVATCLVWAFALLVLDHNSPIPERRRFGASARAHVERRPVLFVVMAPAGSDDTGSPITAHALAYVERGGLIRPVIPRSWSGPDRERGMREFAETYFASDQTVELLRGGAAAGTLRLAGEMRVAELIPSARLTPVGQTRGPGLEREETLLGVSDARLGAPSSGVRPMRESHRAEVERIARRIAKDRFTTWQIESEDVARVRVADLNRDGLPEILASLTLRLRGENRTTQTAEIFIICEGSQNGEYRETYVATGIGETGKAPASLSFVDQIDVSPEPFDEVVLRRTDGASSEFLVLQRRDGAWAEIFASDSIATASSSDAGA